MKIIKTLVLDYSDSVSKAEAQLVEKPAVIVTKDGKYYGVIDHGSMAGGIKEPQKTKCETILSRPPVLGTSASVIERLNAFSTGHFKALPVIDEHNKPLGITTRVELLDDLCTEEILPTDESVSGLMSSPVYTIDEGESIGSVKSMMKEKNARRLVVTKNGYISGVVSAYDLATWSTKAKEPSGRMDRDANSQSGMDKMKISEFLRPDIASVDDKATLMHAVEKMIKNGVSHVVVVSNKKPVGVLSALDVFRKVLDMSTDCTEIAVAGLNEDNKREYGNIRDKIGQVVDKFKKMFNIRNVSVHVKEMKSEFVINLYLETDHGHISLKEERETLKEGVDRIAAELGVILRKKKELMQSKPRTNMGRD
ncbi:CBS domain-containing protein [Candidatus Micrarchaeota archaeon]|nr:CBS domain-containing protein [Candidatus Micrarchaeota archaeon]